MSGLRIAKDFTLPIDAATQTFAILATRGAGKSNAAVVMAEEMWDAKVPWVAIDPKGDWYGIRSSSTGKGPGLPIVVFGGRHGDVPLEPTAGDLLADLVIKHRLTCVLDVSQFTKAETTRFLLAFGRHLFRHADDDGAEPLHLFLEEAHEYLPQVVKGDQADLVNVWQRIVKQGRFKGLGCTMVSQRSSVLNKDVLELIDTLIVLRTIGPLSRKSIAGWVTDQDVDPKLLASLPSLADGEAWIWSPGRLKVTEKLMFRRRRTFDSGATPKVGAKRQTVATLADVDLAAIKEQMAETIERAKADDPKLLHAKNTELTKRIAKLQDELVAARAVTETITERVEVPVVSKSAEILLESIDSALRALVDNASSLAAGMEAPISEIRRGILAVDLIDKGMMRPLQVLQPSPRVGKPEISDRAQAPKPTRTNATPTQVNARAHDLSLGKRERAILSVLAQYNNGRTQRQIALLTGYSAKASTIGAGLSTLRKHGYVTPSGQPIITPEGLDALGDNYDPLPTGPALLEYWRGQLGKRERAILDALLEAAPAPMIQADIAERTGYSADASTIGAGMSKLRGLELVDGWAVSVDFLNAIGSR